MSLFQRIKFHTKRYRNEVLYSSSILAMLMLLIAVAFPNDSEAIADYMGIVTEIGLDALFTTIDLSAPGWLFWVALMGGTYTYFVTAIAAIRIGSNLFPTDEDGALELISTSPTSARMYFTENILASVFALFLIFLPSFLILSVYSLTQSAADSIPRLGAMFLFSLVVCLFFVALSSLGSVFRFSKGTGAKLGYFYLIYAFFLELGAGALEDFADFAKLSVNTYLGPTAGLLNGEHRWGELAILLVIIAGIFALSYYLIKRPDYIEKVSAPSKSRLTFLPRFSPKGKLASRYPLLFDQFRKDRSFFFIYAVIVNILVFYVVIIYEFGFSDDPQAIVDVMAGFSTMINAFTFGYPIQAGFLGFLSFEFFGLLWIYFGLFIFIPAINIPSRDQNRDEQDLLWSNSVTPERVIFNRTASLFIMFTIYYWSVFVVLSAASVLLAQDLSLVAVASTFTVGYFYFVGLMLLLTGIPMFFSVSKGKKYALWFYVISIIILLTAFMVPDLEVLKNFSIVYYFNPVGLVIEDLVFIEELLKSILMLVMSAVVYVAGLKLRFRNVDLLS